MFDDNRWAALRDALNEASKISLRYFHDQDAQEVEQKGDGSPVTKADREIETFLRQKLGTLFPEFQIVGEEFGGDPNGHSKRIWLDPIDGTRAFIHGLESWSILVGFEVETVPVASVVAMPARQELFDARRGLGAFCNKTPLRASPARSLTESMVLIGGLEQFRCNTQMVADTVSLNTSVRAFGDFENYRRMLLGQAHGVIDAFIQPYDICAPMALLREAGFVATDANGNSSIHHGHLIAGTKNVHDALRNLKSVQSVYGHGS